MMASTGRSASDVNHRIGFPLVLWGVLNAGAGLLFGIVPWDMLEGILIQAFAWGVIDGLLGIIAIFGKKPPDINRLKKILRVNIYLDIMYIVAGVIVLLSWPDPLVLGHGIGIAIQGSFLLFHDTRAHGYLSRLDKTPLERAT